jgi:hypothetical protein
MRTIDKSNVSIIPDLKKRKIKLGIEAERKHNELVALVQRAKKLQLVEIE